MDKADIADVLHEIGVLLELRGENPFKVRAYPAAARALETLEESLDDVIAAGRLGEVRGIGRALVEKITTLHATGALKYYDELKASVAPGLLEMLEIPGLGAKKVKAMHEKLGIDTIAALQKACEQGAVAELPGFGAKSQQKILDGIKNREAYGKRHLWWGARVTADAILAGLRALGPVRRAEAAGSLRRGRETVGDLDFLVASEEPGPVMDWFVGQENVQEVTAHGATKSSIRLKGGMQADLRVVPPEQFATALHHFTGSMEHNVMMRQRALARGYSLSEWGIYRKPDAKVQEPEEKRGRPEEKDRVPGIDSEEKLFEFLGLHYIDPALREGRDEIDAAEKGALPRLIEYGDLRGCFHNHTVASDGRNTLEEMAQAAEDLGWDYLGIADHSKASFQANGLDDGRVLKQVEKIRALNASGQFKVRVLAGIECDILPDGELDLDDATLAALDYVVVSVHSSFSQSEEDMTARIIRAIEHPHVHILGHLTGRLLLRREPYKVNARKVIDAAAANGKSIELNANPMRLDMDWRHWKYAAEKGVLCSINPDAHNTEGFQFLHAGIASARKGWLTREHVLNTWPLDDVLKWLKR